MTAVAWSYTGRQDDALSAGGGDLLRGVAEGAEDPVVEAGSRGLVEEVRAHEFPHDLADARHLEDASVAALADERVAVGEPLGARDIGAEEFEQRLVGVLPDDRARAWVDLDDARERGRVVAPVGAVVEDQQVAVVQRARVVLLSERRAAAVRDDL